MKSSENVNLNSRSREEKLDFLELYDLYTQLKGDSRMLIYGMIMGLHYAGAVEGQKRNNKSLKGLKG